MTSTISVSWVPESLIKRIGKSGIDFAQLQWIYFDGMDRIQYDEVLPSHKDKKAYEEMFTSTWVPQNTESFISLDEL